MSSSTALCTDAAIRAASASAFALARTSASSLALAALALARASATSFASLAASSSATAARASAARAASPAADSIADAASSSSSSSLAAAAARLSGESSIDALAFPLSTVSKPSSSAAPAGSCSSSAGSCSSSLKSAVGTESAVLRSSPIPDAAVAVPMGESHATPPRATLTSSAAKPRRAARGSCGESSSRRASIDAFAQTVHAGLPGPGPSSSSSSSSSSSVSISDPPSSSSSRWVHDEASASRSSRLSATPFAPAAPALASQLSIGSIKAVATPVPSTSASPDSVSDSISADSSSSLARSSSLSAAAAAASGESSTFIADSRIDASSDKTSGKMPFGVGVDANGFIDDEENDDDDDRAEDISAERFASDAAAGGGGGLNVNSSEDRLESASSRDERRPFDDAAKIGGVGGTFSSDDPRVGDLRTFSSSPPRTPRPVGPAGVPYSRRAASAVVFTAFHRASAAARSAATLALDFSTSSTLAGASPTRRSSTAVRSFHPARSRPRGVVRGVKVWVRSMGTFDRYVPRGSYGTGTCGAVRSRRGGACAESGGADPSPFEREISDATDAASTSDSNRGHECADSDAS